LRNTQLRTRWAWSAAALGAAVLTGGLLVARGVRVNAQPKPATAAAARAYTTWRDYGGSADSMQFSALTQIDKTNVRSLEPAWTYIATGPGGRFAFSPLIVDDVMYVVGKDNAIVALDAATGRQIWSRPMPDTPTNRGFNYWESADRRDRRIIFAVSNELREIDPRTGAFITTFGAEEGTPGRVDLRKGIPRARSIQSGTPGKIFENLIILGSATGEGYGSPPGDLRAFDVRTGKLVWTFHTIPHPGEFGYDTWPKDAWTYAGGANTWGEISVDTARGIVYFPTGAPTFDLYGGDRIGANLFGNCLLALDARTGKRLWHYQLVHHDLWDYDLVAAPKLLTIQHNGKPVDVVAQASKTGMLYVFDRVSGQPIWPIEERPVPKSDVPGEQSWPTQPFPTQLPPFARHRFSPDDINPYIDAEEAAKLKAQFLAARHEGVFTPPTLTRPFVMLPGQFGGANFGAVAANPETGMLFIRTEDLPTIHQLREWNPRERLQVEGHTPEERGASAFAQLCATCHGPAGPEGFHSIDRASMIHPKDLGMDRVRETVRQGKGQMSGFDQRRLQEQQLDWLIAYLEHPELAPGPPRVPPPVALPKDQIRYDGPLGSGFRTKNGLPAIGPPWARLVAYDLNAGAITWETPLGTVAALAAKGITKTGNAARIHRNGPVATAGGLIFIGTHGDRFVRAFDAATGAIVWERELPANPSGMPAVYEVGGRQFVAFYAEGAQASGGDNENLAVKPADPGAQGYYVFALPASVRGETGR
jgi:quinoprotein glucose dehydrogenase